MNKSIIEPYKMVFVMKSRFSYIIRILETMRPVL
jgi:hypothetical protein